MSIPIKSEKIIFIPKGSIRGIISYLESSGYALSLIDVVLLKIIGSPQSGFIEIPKSLINDCDKDSTTCIMNRTNFLYALTSAKSVTKSITLIPGETSYFLLNDIAKQFNINREALQVAYDAYSPYEDGVILADTYQLPYSDADSIIKYLIDYSMQQHKNLSYSLLGSYDKDIWFSYIAKASIIQKEAANAGEMPIVSSVIDNRIKKGMPLQMDGSLNYGKYSHTRITPDRIRNDTSQFNTYKYQGIPKQPSGSVSIDSIKAAIYPAKTDYLYFMRNKMGTHDFASAYSQHLENIKRVKN